MNDSRNSLISVGIEFGRTTGYGYSYKNKPQNVFTTFWKECPHLSYKVPTALLLDENQTFVAFGYEAEIQYAELLADEEQDEYYYFNEFHKLDEQKVTKDTKMVEASGKSMKALKVVSIVMGFLKDKLIKECQYPLISDDFSFVLVVPSFWNDDAKELILEAAAVAGFQKQTVSIISNLEAAVVFCQNEQSTDYDGTEFMVIHLSDETTDIAVYKKENGLIKELIPPCGVCLGRKSVFADIFDFLNELLGHGVIESLKENYHEEYMDLSREIEIKIRSITIERTKNITITLPISLTGLLMENHETCEYVIENSIFSSKVKYARQKLFIDPDVFKGLFDKTTNGVVSLIKKMLRDPKLKDTNSIYMVGEFAECQLIQSEIGKIIKAPRKLIVKENAGSAVLRGAVRFGHQPLVIEKVAIIDAQPQVAVSNCAFCPKNAIYYCHDCESAFCKECREKRHDKLAVTKEHFVENVKNFDPTMKRPKIKCRDHNEEYSFSCLDCNVLICSMCVTTTHIRHKIGKVSVIVSSARKNAKKQVSKLKSQLQEINSQITILSKTVLFEAKDNASHVTDQIKTAVERITKVLQQRERIKMNITEDANVLQLEEINYSLNEMKKTYDNQFSVCQSIERLIDEKHDVTFYTTYNVLKQEIVDLSVIANYQRVTRVEPFDEKQFLGDFIESLLDEFKFRIRSTEDGKIVLKTK